MYRNNFNNWIRSIADMSGWDVGRTIDYVGFNEPNGAEVRLPNGTMPRYDGAYFDAVLPTVEIIGNRKRKK